MGAADTCVCGCGLSLRRSPSEHFATESCQRTWHQQRVGAGKDSVDVELAVSLAASARPPEITVTNVGWTTIGYTTTGADVYIAPPVVPTRTWHYDPMMHVWELRETLNGVYYNTLYMISRETAASQAEGEFLNAYLRRRFGGHIPPIPTPPND